MRNIDSKSRPRTQFRFKYLAVRIRLLRLGGSLTTFSTVSVKSRHLQCKKAFPLYPRKADIAPRQLGRLSMRFKILVVASRCNEHLARPHPKLRSGSTDCLTTILQTTTAYPTDWACVLPLIPPAVRTGRTAACGLPCAPC